MAAKDTTRQAYDTMLGRELTDAEYDETRNNLAGFFALLMEIDRDLHLPNPTNELPNQ